MREPRNPFRMQNSEKIESELTFLRVFSPGILDVLPKENLWEIAQIICSSPGAGKTTLFYAFTPAVLKALYSSRYNDDYRDFYKYMCDLGAISEAGPQVLGTVISCARNYAILEDLDFPPIYSERLFYALINLRIILSTLKGFIDLKNLKYPDDLYRIKLNTVPDEYRVFLAEDCTGKDVYNWACKEEGYICEIIDSFSPPSLESIHGHNNLTSLQLIRPDNLTVEGKQIVPRVLIMFDDAHKLTNNQRSKLLDSIFQLRSPVNVWLSERLEALHPQDLLSTDGMVGREYNIPIYLEKTISEKMLKRKFEKTLSSIADKRVWIARDSKIDSFEHCLQGAETLDSDKWNDKYRKAVQVISQRIRSKTSRTIEYNEWINKKEAYEGTLRQKAIEWKLLEIMIDRDYNKQLSIDSNMPLSSEELENRESIAKEAKEAAELFISQEFRIPYYYGLKRIIDLASYNIQQFLSFAGELFEESISAELLKRQVSIAPEQQEKILKRVAQTKWDDIIKKLHYGKQVQSLILNICNYAKKTWSKGTASYGGGGGITGIGIQMCERDELIHSKNSQLKLLAAILSECVSNNLLEVRLDVSQGNKKWMILYLNRWICMLHNLPLQYGGWKPKHLNDLFVWCEKDTVFGQIDLF